METTEMLNLLGWRLQGEIEDKAEIGRLEVSTEFICGINRPKSRPRIVDGKPLVVNGQLISEYEVTREALPTLFPSAYSC